MSSGYTASPAQCDHERYQQTQISAQTDFKMRLNEVASSYAVRLTETHTQAHRLTRSISCDKCEEHVEHIVNRS